MDELAEGTAVVTGAGAGIGRALSLRFGAEGMNLVLADIDGSALAEVESELQARNVPVVAQVIDVTRADELDYLAEVAFGRFGGVEILCNNAGVGVPSRVWDVPLDDWSWQFGVNLWGVIHGIRTFLPRMIEGGKSGHIVNTSSLAGVLWGPNSALWGLGAYAASKHAVVGLSLALDGELKQGGFPIGISILCPDAVATSIWDSRRSRPGQHAASPQEDLLVSQLRQGVESGRDPDEVASLVVDAVYENRLFVFTDEDTPARIVGHWTEILNRSG